jgi:hypothetical protein
MKKEPMTIHIEPLLKYALSEKSQSGNYKNVNTYVNEVLTKHVKKQQEEDRVFLEIVEIRAQLDSIAQVLELMLTK